jgi:hypothetical protein
VTCVVQPHVLDSGLAEDFLPFLPIDVRVDRVAGQPGETRPGRMSSRVLQ